LGAGQTPIDPGGELRLTDVVRIGTELRARLDIFKPAAASAAVREAGMNLPSQGRYLFNQLFVLPRVRSVFDSRST
jgi:hypothetical protein